MNRTAIFPYASALLAAALLTACGGDVENDAGRTPTPSTDASCLAVDNSGATVVVGRTSRATRHCRRHRRAIAPG